MKSSPQSILEKPEATANATAVLDNTLLQSEEYFERSEITEITFLDSFDTTPPVAWDFSLNGDGSVLAWLDGTHLYIAGDGGVLADTSAESMFINYQSLESIDLACLDTSNVTDMSKMFQWCNSLTELDLSTFDTSNVTTMRQMFLSCNSLETLIVSEDFFINNPQTAYMFEDAGISEPTEYK